MYVLLIWGYLNGHAVSSFATCDSGPQCLSAQQSAVKQVNATGEIIQSLVCVHTDKVIGSFWEADENGQLKAVSK
jgi:hypothetical protein